MTEPSQDELKESIQELSNYQIRLKEQVINISKKLRMPSNKINSIIKEHDELQKVENMISRLKEQIKLGSCKEES